jgi:hypothetical protein
MTYDKEAWRAEFRERMEEFDRSRGIERAAAPLRSADEPSSRDDLYGIEAQARREWESSAELRQEFGCWEAFLAFRRAGARGAVRIISRSRQA